MQDHVCVLCTSFAIDLELFLTIDKDLSLSEYKPVGPNDFSEESTSTQVPTLDPTCIMCT